MKKILFSVIGLIVVVESCIIISKDPSNVSGLDAQTAIRVMESNKSYVANSLLVSIGLILFVGVFLYTYWRRDMNKLWNEYQEALKSGDKVLALESGRKYYYSRYSNTTNIEDILNNDLKVYFN